MDEKDRHIVSFGDDEPSNDNANGFTVKNEFSYDTEIPKTEPAQSAATGDTFTMKPSEPAVEPRPVAREVSGETFTMRPSEPEAKPELSQERPVSSQTTPKVSTTVESDYTPRRMVSTEPSHAQQAPPKKTKEKKKKYVTTGALIICMVITMIVSSMLSALLLGAFSGKTAGNTAQRNVSKLSELNLSGATGSQLTVAEIIEKNENSVVEIVVEGTAQGMWGQLQLTQGAGSGVIVKENGYIATNYHVVEGANKVEVTLHNGEVYNATVVGTDPENDIAVIKINAKDLETVTIGDSSKVAVGDLAVAIGNPLGQLGGTATAGIVSALDRTLTIEGTTLTLLQTDAAINGGNSGGGLFNGSGELIGIVESKASAVGVEGLAFALPINSVSEIINDMIKNGGNAQTQKSTPAVGVVISEVSEGNAQYYGLDSAGVYIAQVTGSNAKKAGFQEKDRIVSIDGKEVSTSSEFISLVRKHKVGDTVSIVVSRNGQEIEIKTELEELSATQ